MNKFKIILALLATSVAFSATTDRSFTMTDRCPCSCEVWFNPDTEVWVKLSPAPCGGMFGLLGSTCGVTGALVGTSAGVFCPIACALCTGDLQIKRVNNEVRVITPAPATPDVQALVVGAPTQKKM